jgi:hypothetical protein
MNKLFLLPILLFAFLSCEINKNGEARLVISNNSSNTSDVITEVWTRLYNSGEWLAKWNGAKAVNEDAALYLAPASYDVRVTVKRIVLGTIEIKTFETGYKAPIKLSESNYKFIIFDGEGIYDMENHAD